MAGLVPAIQFCCDEGFNGKEFFVALPEDFTQAEIRFCQTILRKDRLLRAHLVDNEIPGQIDPITWLEYLTGLKNTLGNLNNDIAFTATLMIKKYLRDRFSVSDFDAGAKAQGAPGIDIEAKTTDGRIIIGELKTTKPYQPGFGAQQRTGIVKDLNRLARTPADHKFMFVTDAETFHVLTGNAFKTKTAGIEVVNLVAPR